MALSGMDTTTTTEMTGEMKKEHHEHKTHYEMTMADVKCAFKKDFTDEILDASTYCRMAKVAEEAGDETLARGLYEMAYDEYTHAKFIHDNLVDWGCEISENDMIRWHEVKERLERMFRS